MSDRPEFSGALNSSFSRHLPELQLAWDSVSLNAAKKCWTYYDLTIRQGWTDRAENIHLEFGLALHSASETYNRLKALGTSHDDAVLEVVQQALKATWDQKLGRPRPVFCDDKNKNRFTLVRTIVWYFEQFKEDPCETMILNSGRPAVELSFRMDLHKHAVTKESFLLCGHIDRVANFQDQAYILDIKSTKYTLDQDYFKKFSPFGQFSGYALAGKVEFGIPVRGIMVDAAQVAVTFSRFLRGQVSRDEATLQEWYEDTLEWIDMAQERAKRNHWPKNDTACDMYGGCDLREICSKSPLTRGQWIERGFTKRVWDPLQRRGDI